MSSSVDYKPGNMDVAVRLKHVSNSPVPEQRLSTNIWFAALCKQGLMSLNSRTWCHEITNSGRVWLLRHNLEGQM